MKCDISNKNLLKGIIKEFQPTIIIHCAALSNVDQCEIDKDLANTINIVSTAQLII